MTKISPLDKLKQFNATFKSMDNKDAVAENKPTAKLEATEIAKIVSAFKKTRGYYEKQSKKSDD